MLRRGTDGMHVAAVLVASVVVGTVAALSPD